MFDIEEDQETDRLIQRCDTIIVICTAIACTLALIALVLFLLVMTGLI